MSEHDISTRLRTATEHLDPDIPVLVAGGRERGRRAARRRTAVQSVGIGLGAVALGAGVWAIAPGSTPADQEVGYAGGTGTDAGPALTTPLPGEDFTPSTGTMPTSDRTPLAATDLPGAFAEVAPGEITTRDPKEPEVAWNEFLWNGFSTTVSVMPSQTEGTPLERCRAVDPVTADECSTIQDGTVVRRTEHTGSGTPVNAAVIYAADGWEVRIAMTNAGFAKSRPIADAPAMPAAQLLEIALIGKWFS